MSDALNGMGHGHILDSFSHIEGEFCLLIQLASAAAPQLALSAAFILLLMT